MASEAVFKEQKNRRFSYDTISTNDRLVITLSSTTSKSITMTSRYNENILLIINFYIFVIVNFWYMLKKEKEPIKAQLWFKQTVGQQEKLLMK